MERDVSARGYAVGRERESARRAIVPRRAGQLRQIRSCRAGD